MQQPDPLFILERTERSHCREVAMERRDAERRHGYQCLHPERDRDVVAKPADDARKTAVGAMS